VNRGSSQLKGGSLWMSQEGRAHVEQEHITLFALYLRSLLVMRQLSMTQLAASTGVPYELLVVLGQGSVTDEVLNAPQLAAIEGELGVTYAQFIRECLTLIGPRQRNALRAQVVPRAVTALG
jgi:hypothetical protein